MCRWVAYLGAPIAPKELLHDPERSLIEQSRRHAPNMEIANGDGTGLGWYDRRSEPALFRSIVPAWGDTNLLELAAEIRGMSSAQSRVPLATSSGLTVSLSPM